jgi:hypothetical protein
MAGSKLHVLRGEQEKKGLFEKAQDSSSIRQRPVASFRTEVFTKRASCAFAVGT